MKITHTALAGSALLLAPFSHGQSTKPDALLQIDINRAAVVERIVEGWKSELPAAQIASFRSKLSTLRADHLLAANLSGSFDGVLEVLSTNNPRSDTRISTMQSSQLADKSKSLGDTNQDLVYTPITPCRVFDTRVPNTPFVSNGLTSGVTQTFDMDGTNLGPQGGSPTGCSIPTAARAVVLAFSPILPPTTGWVVGAANDGVPLPASTLFNYGPEVSLSTFTVVMPMLGQAGGDIRLEARGVAAYSMHGVGDVTGYFMPPSRNGDGLRVTNVNAISPNMVGGAAANSTRDGVRGATIAGGGVITLGDPDYGADAPNRVTDHYGVIGGGMSNRVGNDNIDVGDAAFATIAGGRNNTAGGSASFVGGGFDNFATGFVSTVAGGEFNQSPDAWAFVGGGRFNTAAGVQSAIAGGLSNTSGGTGAFVGGGASNSAAGPRASVLGGFSNTASGQESVVLGGNNNLASGPTSLAAGRKANAPLAGCFVWGDSLDEVVDCKVTNEFVARATGGYRLITGKKPDGSPLGAYLPAGDSAWTTISDINAKSAIQKVDPQSVLRALAKIPLLTWQYAGQQGNVRHMGPSAQDFYKAFGLGSTPLGISTVDADGVALAAIQGLLQTTSADSKAKDAKLSLQAEKIRRLEQELAAIKKKLGL
jgi:Chaperone of endosialidase